ncbi:hypothetical protein, partial [Methanococcoides sp. AM1]|uniref:hypothetical protein n=1 Tax=Methanococcoides sp. AM1 TaxID=1201011 RepID=UPI0014382D39
IILEANEQWKPWLIAQSFAINSIIKHSTGIIYFSFARPYVNIKKDIERKFQKEIYKLNEIDLNEKELTFDQKEKIQYQIDTKLNNIIIIDCFAPLTLKEKKYTSELLKRIKKNKINDNVLTADPRNPHLLNQKYHISITRLINLKKFTHICVVYDSLSDFLCFTDREIAIHYLRHNMCWEENHNVSSLY